MAVPKVTALTALAGLFLALPASVAGEQPLRVPDVPDSRIVRKVNPVYPLAAVRRRIQGSVTFSALIGKDGRVERLRVISGHPLLIDAAQEAAKQWVYVPATVGGVPVRVLTRIRIHFALASYLAPRKVASVTRDSRPERVIVGRELGPHPMPAA